MEAARGEHLRRLARSVGRARMNAFGREGSTFGLHRLAARLGLLPRPASPDALGFVGDFSSWEEAAAEADGYGAEVILRRVLEASRTARDDPRWHERDGTLFSDPPWNFPMLACLLRVAVACRGNLSVLDFGGALGSSYRLARPWLDEVPQLQWSIVEQEHFVSVGRREFESDELRFFASIGEACTAVRPNVAVLSSVLQYLDHPGSLFDDLARAAIDWIIVDRTPVLAAARDRITVQHVPATVYGRAVRYPARLFAREALHATIARTWPIVFETAALDGTWSIGASRVDFRLMLAGPRR